MVFFMVWKLQGLKRSWRLSEAWHFVKSLVKVSLSCSRDPRIAVGNGLQREAEA